MNRKPIPFSFVAGAAWVACAVLAALETFGMYPLRGITLCPFKLLTGHNCPGCGMSRAVIAAMRGQFAASAHFHILGIPLLVVWTVWLLDKAVCSSGGMRSYRNGTP